MSRTITTNGTIGIYLADPLDNPVMVAASGTISTANDYAILGSAAVAWTLTNFGKLSGGQSRHAFRGKRDDRQQRHDGRYGNQKHRRAAAGWREHRQRCRQLPRGPNQRQLYWRADRR